ncbi:hypothetical protein C0Q70_13460 [Pomacea canaliculata]|uniref:Uncharacterized protein n=1 Tax=Pomacea canaliculata TaxID=400727 RepID=A0A2T7NX92_POMCA|nr:hypothetical protein C0Q70_13460 [Pomacea canaliculata]
MISMLCLPRNHMSFYVKLETFVLFTAIVVTCLNGLKIDFSRLSLPSRAFFTPQKRNVCEVRSCPCTVLSSTRKGQDFDAAEKTLAVPDILTIPRLWQLLRVTWSPPTAATEVLPVMFARKVDQSFDVRIGTVRRPNEKDRELPIVLSSVASRECPSGTAADGGIACAERVLLLKGVCWKRIARRAFSLATQISLSLDPRWSSPARTAGWDRSPERRHQSVNSRCLASVQEPW